MESLYINSNALLIILMEQSDQGSYCLQYRLPMDGWKLSDYSWIQDFEADFP